MEYYQEPVLVKELVEIFDIRAGGTFLDLTVGEGGHASIFVNHLVGGVMVVMDRDEEILGVAKRRLLGGNLGCKLYVECGHFLGIGGVLKRRGIEGADYILYDLGVSMYHIRSGRGFSFTDEESLDMRLDRGIALSGYDVVNSFGEEDLADIFWKYGEERHSRRVARNIVRYRKEKKIGSGNELKGIVERSLPYVRRKGRRICGATKTFQALRIYINGDLEGLEDGICEGMKALKVGGKLGVISFHSLEDRIVKRLFRRVSDVEGMGGFGGIKTLTKKVIKPTREEMGVNFSSRSARLRVIERVF